MSPKDLLPRVADTALREPTLLRAGDVLVGARCHRPDRHTERWSVHACDVLQTDVAKDRWSQPLASRCLDVLVDEVAGYVATSEEQRLLFWDLATGAPRFKEMDGFHPTAALPNNRLLSLEEVPGMTPDGAKHDQGTRACILDIERGDLVTHFGLRDKVKRVSVNDAGTHLIACGRRAILWDVERKEPVLGFDDGATGDNLSFLPGATAADGTHRALLPYHFGMGGPLLLDVKVGALRVEITRLADPGAKGRAPLMSWSVSPDGRFLATAHADHIDNHRIEGNAICIWDLHAKALAKEVDVRGESSPYLYAWPRANAMLGIYEGWHHRELFRAQW